MAPGPVCLVVGGGIGGLAAALALLRGGFDARVYEQAPQLGEVGAGLTLSRGALACCERLGIADAVRQQMAPARAFPYLHYRTGAHLERDDAPPKPPDAAPGGHIYRADFHGVLVDAVREFGADRIVLGHALTAVEQDAQGATARFANGGAVRGDVLIAADGVRSVVRGAVFGEGPPEFTNRIAYRFMLPAAEGLPFLDVGGPACLFVGHGRVFNRYLVSGDRLVNCVALQTNAPWTREGWNVPATTAELLEGFAGWHESVLALMQCAPPGKLIKWGIYARPPRDEWVRGRVALLGDAAHPMQPFLGLGAAMAVEDATILGRAFREKEDVAEALDAYARARVPRANRVLMLSKKQGDLFDSTDPADFPPRDTPSHDPSIAAFNPACPLP